MSFTLAPVSPPELGVLGRLGALVDQITTARTRAATALAEEAALLAEAAGLIAVRAAERRRAGLSTANDLPVREIAAELGAAMRVSDRTVQRRMSDAYTVVVEFPATHQAWSEGRIDKAHVAVIADEGAVIDDPVCRRVFEEQILTIAESETPGRLQKIARTIAARIDPTVSAKRRKKAIKARDVRVFDLGDGMSRMQIDGPSPLIHGGMDRLTQFAHTIHDTERAAADDGGAPQGAEFETDSTDSTGPSELRSLGEIRADVLADLLLTAVPTAHHGPGGAALTGIRGEVHVTIPVATAAGVSDEPATMPACGPIDAGLARRILATTPTWNRVLTDLASGLPVAVDRYRPSAELRRFIDYRDEHCRFPGCLMKPWRCDADHAIDAAHGGPTTAGNLADFCRRHHTLKHASPWAVQQTGHGDLRWTSPTGRVYTDRVPATVTFVPSPLPDHNPPPF